MLFIMSFIYGTLLIDSDMRFENTCNFSCNSCDLLDSFTTFTVYHFLLKTCQFAKINET